MKVTKEQLEAIIQEAWKRGDDLSGSVRRKPNRWSRALTPNPSVEQENMQISKAHARKSIVLINKVKDNLQEIFENEADWRPLESAMDKIMDRIMKKYNQLEKNPDRHYVSVKMKEEKKS